MSPEPRPPQAVIADVLGSTREVNGGELESVLTIYRPEGLAVLVMKALKHHGYAVIEDEPHHYVTFDDDGWFVEHSVACRVAGTIGTCEFNAAVREIADEPEPDQFGRWRITDIDNEGLPSLERSDHAVR